MPQIEVEEVKNPDLDAQIMAERLAYSLDRGRHYRRAGYYILRKVMDAGARGVEIVVSGKVTSQRARTQIFRAGTMSKSGQPAQEAVDKGVAQCIMKTGVMGVIVKIMRADYKMGDGVVINNDALKKAQIIRSKELGKTEAEKILEGTNYDIEEIERDLTDEEKELIDEVDEEDVSEISLIPKDDDEDKEE